MCREDGILWEISDAGPGGETRLTHLVSEDKGMTTCRADQTHQDLHSGRLTRTVGAEEATYGTCCNVDAEAV